MQLQVLKCHATLVQVNPLSSHFGVRSVDCCWSWTRSQVPPLLGLSDGGESLQGSISTSTRVIWVQMLFIALDARFLWFLYFPCILVMNVPSRDTESRCSSRTLSALRFTTDRPENVCFCHAIRKERNDAPCRKKYIPNFLFNSNMSNITSFCRPVGIWLTAQMLLGYFVLTRRALRPRFKKNKTTSQSFDYSPLSLCLCDTPSITTCFTCTLL